MAATLDILDNFSGIAQYNFSYKNDVALLIIGRFRAIYLGFENSTRDQHETNTLQHSCLELSTRKIIDIPCIDNMLPYYLSEGLQCLLY